ncbi:MAG TPA: hypothetical protein VGW38_18175 [Chloroflexota bacterium]|nr:hypothetical protein [Chloroflexota bacterium]
MARVPFLLMVRRWYQRRPLLTSWVFLATGMVGLMLLFGWSADLTLRQYVTLSIATAGLAWLCVWIISLEDREHDGRDESGSAA